MAVEACADQEIVLHHIQYSRANVSLLSVCFESVNVNY